MDAFRNVFHNANSPGGGFPTLGGRSAYLYDEKNDLMSLSTLKEDDSLTALVRYSLSWLFAVSLPTFALLFGAIYHLYSVSDDRTKSGLIAFYTVSFAICLGLVTSAGQRFLVLVLLMRQFWLFL